jgi:hypothetical protein
MLVRKLPMPQADAPAAAPAPPPLPVAEIARRLDLTLGTLLLLIAAQFRTLGTLTTPVWCHFAAAQVRLARLLGHLAAGRLPRPHRPRPHPRRQAARPSRPRPRPRLPSRRHGWLGHILDYNVRSAASQIQGLLRQPGVPETLAQAPGVLRTLRPLCHMLGVELPPALRLPPRPPRRRRPRPTQPVPEPPATPDRPIPRYVLDAARAWKRPAERQTPRPHPAEPPPPTRKNA